MKKAFSFLLLTSLSMLFVTWSFPSGVIQSEKTLLFITFHFFAWLFYSAFYALVGCLPLFLISSMASKKRMLNAITAIFFSSAALIFIKSDSLVYDLYGFHFNGFVWNLLTTPGGISSLGAGNDAYFLAALLIAAIFLIQTFFYYLVYRAQKLDFSDFFIKGFVLFLAAIFFVQAIIYGFNDAKGGGSIVDTAYVYPYYKRVRFRHLGHLLGIERIRKDDSTKLTVDGSRLNYPLATLQYEKISSPSNIIILVAESLRWDRMTPEMMPNTWELGKKGQIFKRHYSSGNGTREGMFGIFYGLYGAYWNSFLNANKSPILVDRLQDLGYQLDIRTSAKFSYPEFNKTLFSKVSLDKLHEEPDTKKPWERDRDNISGMINDIRHRDSSKPYFGFMFFESTHARYDFPDEAAIAKPYLNNLNYMSMSRKSLAQDIVPLRNRYTNSAHWVDVQVGRLVEELQAQGLMKNTIIIITGDHGEEFMEKGFWGHNSSFVEEQTHTPLVTWFPDEKQKQVDYLTSHIDISVTLNQHLGLKNKEQDYSLGKNLFNPDDRAYVVTSDWRSIGIKSNEFKYRIPYISHGVDTWHPTSTDDGKLNKSEEDEIILKNKNLILDAVKNTKKFLDVKKHKKEAQ